MQRITSFVKTITRSINLQKSGFDTRPLTMFSTFRNSPGEALLTPRFPILNSIRGMKVKGRVRRRCKSCYLVFRDERVYVMCPKFPRHKQMSMVPKPHNTWILTHASQSPVRPW